MSLRKDLPQMIILVHKFQKFDQGQEIEQMVPIHWNLKAGDRIYWEVAQYTGIAEVISCKEEGQDSICIFKKLN